MLENQFELEPHGQSQTKRLTVPAAEDILFNPFKCLDDGFVRLMDYSGGDEAIVQAARVSYGKGTKKVSDDTGLIRYLMRNRHTTPFEMVELKFHVRVPMDCWRQWIRHRTANVNEYSTRYSEAIDAAQKTSPLEWRSQATGNRQGSGDFLPGDIGIELTRDEEEVQKMARTIYEQRIKAGVAREQARKDLPLSTYTEAYWKIDLHNLFHFLGLRMDSHAQKEIREYATIIGEEIVYRVAPIAYSSFKDYVLNSVKFSAIEQVALKSIIGGESPEQVAENSFPNIREREEFLGKARKLLF